MWDWQNPVFTSCVFFKVFEKYTGEYGGLLSKMWKCTTLIFKWLYSTLNCVVDLVLLIKLIFFPQKLADFGCPKSKFVFF